MSQILSFRNITRWTIVHHSSENILKILFLGKSKKCKWAYYMPWEALCWKKLVISVLFWVIQNFLMTNVFFPVLPTHILWLQYRTTRNAALSFGCCLKLDPHVSFRGAQKNVFRNTLDFFWSDFPLDGSITTPKSFTIMV